MTWDKPPETILLWLLANARIELLEATVDHLDIEIRMTFEPSAILKREAMKNEIKTLRAALAALD